MFALHFDSDSKIKMSYLASLSVVIKLRCFGNSYFEKPDYVRSLSIVSNIYLTRLMINHINNSMMQELSYGGRPVEQPLTFMKPRVSLPCSQKPVTGLSNEADAFYPRFSILYEIWG